MTDFLNWTLSCRDSGTSTSDLAKSAAIAGAPSGSAFLLHEQTAGRGRRGRRWKSERGGMYVSVIIYPIQPRESWYGLSFAAALAVRDTVESHLIEKLNRCGVINELPEIGLKWPNDILVDNRKISGVLLEADDSKLIIGSGINIAKIESADNSQHPPIGLADFPGVLPSPKELAKIYLKHLQYYYQLWEKNGFEPLRKIWLSHSLHMGKSITVRVGKSQITGVFDKLNCDGALILLDEFGKSHHITTGDVELIGS